MSDDPFAATIVAGGQRYSAWKSVMVRRDYGDSVSVFQFTAAEPEMATGGWAALRLKPGDACQILLGGQKVIDGSITTRNAAFDAEEHDLVVAGKSLTQHATKASVQIKPGTYSGNTFEQVSRAALQPLGIGLKIQNPPEIVTKPFKDLVIQYGETVHELIERLARFRGLILSDDKDGNLVAGQVDPNKAPVADLVEGRNILRASGRLENQTAWSRLAGVGQQVATDDSYGAARDVSASVTNPNADARDQQTFVAEMPVDKQDLQQRLNFEAARNLWTTVQVSITVVGWFRAPGVLWDVAEHVSVTSPMLFPTETGSFDKLGIQAVTFRQDDQDGTTTTLDLVLSTALTTRPNPYAGQGSGDPISNPNPNQAQPDGSDFSI